MYMYLYNSEQAILSLLRLKPIPFLSQILFIGAWDRLLGAF